MNRLEVDSVTLEFGRRQILTNVYMRFETGCVTGILGRNGTGKSCLLRIIYGTLKAQYSNIRFNGQMIVNAYGHPEKVRYLPQSCFVPKYIPLQRVLKIFKCDPALFLFQFPEFSDEMAKPFRQFSFGQKRLIETWLILTSDSEFVLLDEPFSYLMPVHVDRLKEIIMTEKKRKGIVITDHLYRDLLEVKDNLYLIQDGKSHVVKGQEELRLLGYLV